jgi:cytochrome c
LYQENCESCHGRNGDGKGRAAANLFPPARNFRDEPMRMVSTENRLASDVDLMQTIRNGLPGTSMASFARLSEFEIYSIIEVLRQFVIDGLGQQYKREIEVRGDDLNIDSQSSWMEARATPSQPIVVPMFDLTANLIEQGKGVFERSGCGGCHRTSQEDSGSRLRLFDSIGRPILAPNLAQDTFHRGASGAEIYKRIALGIPGTPHPALSSEKADELTSIVAYILSCRSVPTKPTTNYDRSPAGSR